MEQRNGLSILFAMFLSLFSMGHALTAIAEPGETLIVFTDSTGSTVNATFRDTTLPAIRSLAQSMGVAVKIDRLEKGAPAEVGITPLIVYQNPLGRSVYQGRTTTLDRLRNFIRTSRRIPQGKEIQVLQNTPVFRSGRGVVYSPLKISELGGTRPDGYIEKNWQKESTDAILSGFSSYTLEGKVALKRSDRGFYMDFYPWRGSDGTLFIALALFSQFHCKKPVFELIDQKITGPWKDRRELFKKAGAMMEAEVKKRIADPNGGDGFDVVSKKLPVVSWESLGYAIPAPVTSKRKSTVKRIELPIAWHAVRPPSANDPVVQFHFEPPLDNYSGEFKQVEGRLTFSPQHLISSMKGDVKTFSDSVTMGEKDLDHTIISEPFLNSGHFPVSRFILSSATGRDKTLEFGRLTLLTLNGSFILKGKTIPLSLPVEMETVLDDHDVPELLVRGAFPIDLRRFGIEGAFGPEPQKYMVTVELNLIFSPGP